MEFVSLAFSGRLSIDRAGFFVGETETRKQHYT